MRRLQRRWVYHSSDRRKAHEAADFIEQDQASWLRPNPDETPEHWNKKIKTTVSLAEYVLGKTARTYAAPPQRTPAGDDEQHTVAEWLRRHVWEYGENGLDLTLGDADLWTLYTGSVAIEPRYDLPDGATPGDGDGIEALYYRRHEFEVLPRPRDARRPEAVILPLVAELTEAGAQLSESTVTLDRGSVYYDDEVMCYTDGWSVDEEQGADDPRWDAGLFRHGLGRLPVVFARNTREQRRFHGRGVHLRLKGQCQAINKLWTEYVHTLRVQHGYLWAEKNLKSKTLAADAIIITGEGNPLGMLTPGANLEGMLDGIQRLMDTVAVTMGMAPGSLRLDPREARSGIAILAERQGQDEVRGERLPIWQHVERAWIRAAVDVYRVFSGVEPPAGADRVSVVFREPPAQVSRQEQREQLDWEIKHKLVSRRRALRRMYPELSDIEADAWLAEADAETAGTAAAAQPASLGQLLGGGPGQRPRRLFAETPAS